MTIQSMCVAMLSMVATASASASCLCPANKGSVCSIMERAEGVIVGTVVEMATHSDNRLSYGITVSASYKGSIPQGSTVEVFTSRGTCGVPALAEGQTYLLTVDRTDGEYLISSCGYNRFWGLFGARQQAEFESGAALRCNTKTTAASADPIEPVALNRRSVVDNPEQWLAGGPSVELSFRSTDFYSSPNTESASAQSSSTTKSTKVTQAPRPKKRKSCRNGDKSVPDGWTGRGVDDNSCNVCVCTSSVLACTKMMCLDRE